MDSNAYPQIAQRYEGGKKRHLISLSFFVLASFILLLISIVPPFALLRFEGLTGHYSVKRFFVNSRGSTPYRQDRAAPL